jgi:hypothetical protein
LDGWMDGWMEDGGLDRDRTHLVLTIIHIPQGCPIRQSVFINGCIRAWFVVIFLQVHIGESTDV